MADFITPFDPSTKTSGNFAAMLPNGGWIFIHNDSPIELTFQVGNMASPVLVPAFVARCFPVRQPINLVKWANVGTVESPGQSPISLVYGELYQPNEWTGGELYIALARMVNVGNTVSTSGSSKLINDGNSPGTQIIESTPSDQSASSFALNNDGSGFWQVLSAGVLRKLINVVRGNSGVTKATFTIGDAGDTSITTLHGTADLASSVPATGVTAGALPAGVTLPATQVSAGALPAGVTLPATQVSAGALPAGVTSPNYLPLAGGTMTGAITSTSAVVMSNTASNAGIEHGNPNAANTPFVDFHSSGGALRDYDARIVASGGNTAADGQGTLEIIAAILQVLASVQATDYRAPNQEGVGFAITDNFTQLEFDTIAPEPGNPRGMLFKGIDTAGTLHSFLQGDAGGVAHIGTDDAGTGRLITPYLGTTDPAGRAGITVNEGDVWIDA